MQNQYSVSLFYSVKTFQGLAEDFKPAHLLLSVCAEIPVYHVINNSEQFRLTLSVQMSDLSYQLMLFPASLSDFAVKA